ncbi:uncharacterized protein LOC126972597 [Leptidea sinapis]|uniref:uncharacterized protein LOC126972597 n=1 Tax=Leptidea sinapis TaxID=189913 RepID=UPI00212F889A|nr:uncharacterized protein LOC126972597 [Leptidea sinapis]
MDKVSLNTITLNKFKWLNEPKKWSRNGETLEITTDNRTDFWQGTWYDFHFNTGHLYGVILQDDFTFEVCIEAKLTTLYDQAGLMIYLDETHWLKAGIEYNDGQPMIGSVLTNGVSDWATGLYTGDPKRFWMRLTKVGNVICVKYSVDCAKWILLRLCPFCVPEDEKFLVGPMCCTPQRQGLVVKFSNFSVTSPAKDILHSN